MNNYTDEDLEKLDTFFEVEVIKGGYQAEISKKGTKHIQGFFSLAKRSRFQQFGLKPGTHFEAMRGTILENVKYCTKSKSFDTERNLRVLKNCGLPDEIVTIDKDKMFKWQLDALNILEQKPDDRVVY
jgi:hypothetical protein